MESLLIFDPLELVLLCIFGEPAPRLIVFLRTVGSVVTTPFWDNFSCLSLASLISLNLSDGLRDSESDCSMTSWGLDFIVIFCWASLDFTDFNGELA